jgi:hypothetical protein
MTYFIAAPLLYKVIVVNNLASLFLGVDDTVQSHQEGCLKMQSKQTMICHSVIRKDGTAYQCPRHIAPSNMVSGNDRDPSKPGIFHKQQLLKFVKGVHFVYSSADRHMYGNIRLEDYVNEDGVIDEEILRNVDLGRYLNIPDCVKSGRIRPLPNLSRLSVATWLGKCTNPIIESKLVWCTTPVSQAHRLFERYLASKVYRFPSCFVCHYPSNGFLTHYPPYNMGNFHNAIHEADLATFGPRLRAGAENLVFVVDNYNKTPFEVFAQGYWMVIQHLVDAAKKWRVGRSEFEDTKTTFVIERSMDQDYCEMTNEELEKADDDIKDLREKFKAELEMIDPLSDWCDWMWDTVWVEEHLACPSCEHELWKEIRETFDDTSSLSSNPSTTFTDASIEHDLGPSDIDMTAI